MFIFRIHKREAYVNVLALKLALLVSFGTRVLFMGKSVCVFVRAFIIIVITMIVLIRYSGCFSVGR